MLNKLLQETVYKEEKAVSLLSTAGLQVEDSFLTRRQLSRKVAMEEFWKLTTTRSGADKDIGIKLAIAVTNRFAFSVEQHGEVTELAECLGSSFKFAKKVLEAVGKGEAKSLFKRSRRKDSLVASDWPGVLWAFLDRPLYSRLVPGNDSVSLYYGHR